MPPTEIPHFADKIHHFYEDDDDWSVIQSELSMHCQVYEAAMYFEDEILKFSAISNTALCLQAPYKDCDLYEAVNFVYNNAER